MDLSSIGSFYSSSFYFLVLFIVVCLFDYLFSAIHVFFIISEFYTHNIHVVDRSVVVCGSCLEYGQTNKTK